ncbi:MAG: GIY-YIG nuclease family protein [Roseburia sp.]|nr:GIY-YIG nuclease family protein [Roseburia sp.]
MGKTYYVYIATNHTNSTLYVGVTNDICRRTFEHKSKVHDGFTKQYNIYKLVYAESTGYINDAIAREKQIKHWSRAKKLALINSVNPEWNDLLTD